MMEQGRDDDEKGEMRQHSGNVRAGSRPGDSDRGRIPDVYTDGDRGDPADRLRHIMSETIGGKEMKIVVWKAPKMLRGILARFFGIRS